MRAAVATIDTVAGAATLDRFPEATAQAACADRLVLTKTDLATPSPQSLDLLAALNPTALMTQRPHACVDTVWWSFKPKWAAAASGNGDPRARHSLRGAGATPADVTTAHTSIVTDPVPR